MFLYRKSDIFTKVGRLAQKLGEAAQLLKDVAQDWEQLKDASHKLEHIEHEADELVHAIKDEIEKTFILPLDKEDIAELTEKLDDVVDNIEEVVNRLKIYDIPGSNDTLKQFSQLIMNAVKEIQEAINMIVARNFVSDNFLSVIKTLRGLEADGDTLHRSALANLMKSKGAGTLNEEACMFVLKWKEIFQTLENTLDTCDDIAILFAKLRIKYI